MDFEKCLHFGSDRGVVGQAREVEVDVRLDVFKAHLSEARSP